MGAVPPGGDAIGHRPASIRSRGARIRRRRLSAAAIDELVVARLALLAVLAIAAALETWSLAIGGYGNGYYAEAALAASRSWTALLTNAADPSALTSLDKGPLPNAIMGLSSRAFGFGAFSLMLPNALYAVAAVAILHDTVRRLLGRRTALLAALMLALSPVSVTMGRYDNPDALLALLLVGSAWAFVCALQSGRLAHVVCGGALVGLAFNTKMLEACLIVPGLAGAFLLAAPGSLVRRVGQLAIGGLAMLSVSFAWYATMTLLPAAGRPYVAESSDDSWLQLIFGANGVSRIVGSAGARHVAAGPLRLFGGEMAGEAAWLLPLASVGLIAGLWLARHSPRTDPRRVAAVLFGLWLAAGYYLFSFSRGIFHSYYTSAIAPPIAALAAAAIVLLAERARGNSTVALALAGGLLGTGALSWSILAHTPGFAPWLRWLVLGAAALVALAALRARSARRPPRPASLAIVVAAALLALLGGPTAYSIATASVSRTGSSPTAGPASLTPVWDRAGALALATADAALVGYLERHRGGARYLVAATGADFAAPIGLATGAPVITLGGFDGSGSRPTVAQLASLIHAGELRYVLLATANGRPGARERDRWVLAHCARVISAARLGRGLRGENGAGLHGFGTAASMLSAGLYSCVDGELP